MATLRPKPTVSCPTCGVYFPLNQIEEHADHCVEALEQATAAVQPRKKVNGSGGMPVKRSHKKTTAIVEQIMSQPPERIDTIGGFTVLTLNQIPNDLQPIIREADDNARITERARRNQHVMLSQQSQSQHVVNNNSLPSSAPSSMWQLRPQIPTQYSNIMSPPPPMSYMTYNSLPQQPDMMMPPLPSHHLMQQQQQQQQQQQPMYGTSPQMWPYSTMLHHAQQQQQQQHIHPHTQQWFTSMHQPQPQSQPQPPITAPQHPQLWTPPIMQLPPTPDTSMFPTSLYNHAPPQPPQPPPTSQKLLSQPPRSQMLARRNIRRPSIIPQPPPTAADTTKTAQPKPVPATKRRRQKKHSNSSDASSATSDTASETSQVSVVSSSPRPVNKIRTRARRQTEKRNNNEVSQPQPPAPPTTDNVRLPILNTNVFAKPRARATVPRVPLNSPQTLNAVMSGLSDAVVMVQEILWPASGTLHRDDALPPNAEVASNYWSAVREFLRDQPDALATLDKALCTFRDDDGTGGGHVDLMFCVAHALAGNNRLTMAFDRFLPQELSMMSLLIAQKTALAVACALDETLLTDEVRRRDVARLALNKAHEAASSMVPAELRQTSTAPPASILARAMLQKAKPSNQLVVMADAQPSSSETLVISPSSLTPSPPQTTTTATSSRVTTQALASEWISLASKRFGQGSPLYVRLLQCVIALVASATSSPTAAENTPANRMKEVRDLLTPDHIDLLSIFEGFAERIVTRVVTVGEDGDDVKMAPQNELLIVKQDDDTLHTGTNVDLIDEPNLASAMV